MQNGNFVIQSREDVPQAKKTLERDETAFVNELKKIGIPESARQDFISRARESQERAVVELNTQASPEELMRDYIDELYALLTPVILQIVLSAEPIAKGKAIDVLALEQHIYKDSPNSLREFINTPRVAVIFFFSTLAANFIIPVAGLMTGSSTEQITALISSIVLSVSASTVGILKAAYDGDHQNKVFKDSKQGFFDAVKQMKDMLTVVVIKEGSTGTIKDQPSHQKVQSPSDESSRIKHLGDRDDDDSAPRRDVRQTQ